MADEVEVIIRKAVPEDAAAVLSISKQLAKETDFLIMDETGMGLSEELLALHLGELYEDETNALFLAFSGDQVVGMASMRASKEPTVAHIGELGISVLKDYWGMGLGSVLLDELMYWATSFTPLRRIELQVQKRNTRAVHLYEKFDFTTEAVIARGARSAEGEFLDVLLMRRLID